MQKPGGYKGSFYRENLIVSARKKGQGGETRKEILALVREHEGESGIVYCLSRKAVEQTSDFLVRNGVRAAPYHAGLPDADRELAQDSFQRDDVDVIVATVAFGMGIDKSNVRFVIHRDMPRDVESWYQEMGRSGRDGLESDCVVFYSWADVKMHERFLNDIDDPEVWHEKRRNTVALFELLESGRCRHQGILAHFDEPMAPCETSCDVCTGVSVADRVAEAMVRHGRSRDPRKSPGRRTGIGPPRGSASGGGAPGNRTGFESLRSLRKHLADQEGVPAYIVFSDKVLVEMLERRPRTPAELLTVPGVGPAKLERYGEAFLQALQELEG
jgi:ATP-dependent DNA helicase RecQ